VVPLAQKRPPFWRYDRSRREILFSAYHMSPVNLGAYAAELRRTQPPWLHGYPSVLALLASYIVEVGFDLGYRVRWVTTGAENLLSHQADLIDRAFGVRPRQHYGLAEAVANISECDMGALHVDEDFAAVEFEPGPDGAGHGIVGTNFSNPATPLLRYRTQDFVTLSDLPCACGRPGRVVAGVDGRLEDYVVLRNGARIGRMDHVFKDLTNIREAQIHQRVPGEITIRVVRGNRYSRADETKLLREAGKRVGEGTAVHVEYVGQLDRSPSNKLRLVVSEIPRGRLVPHGTPCAVTTRP
jgi:phenylacetate-CoA ligase